MSTLFEFNRYNQDQQLALIWSQGFFLKMRVSGAFSVGLYSMGRYFAEIWYRTADNQIEFVRSYNNQAMQDSLLDMTDLMKTAG